MISISLDSTGLPVLLLTLLSLAPVRAFTRPMPGKLDSRLGNAGKSHDGFLWSHARLINGLAVEADVGLVYTFVSGTVPIWGTEMPYSAGLYGLRGRRCAVLLVLVVLAGVVKSSMGEKLFDFGDVE